MRVCVCVCVCVCVSVFALSPPRGGSDVHVHHGRDLAILPFARDGPQDNHVCRRRCVRVCVCVCVERSVCACGWMSECMVDCVSV